MPNFTFDDTIPASGNNPSSDQPIMLINNASTESILAVNHYTFNDNDGGLHLDVEMPRLNALPTIYNNLSGTLYTRQDSTFSRTQLFYTNNDSGNEYQLTACSNANFSLFGKNTNNYNNGGAVGTEFTGGWTFLAGNQADGALILQYGNYNNGSISPSTIPVTFPIDFTDANSINVTLSPICRSSGTSLNDVVSLVNGSISTSGFTANFQTSTSEYVGFTWMAIGF